MKDLHPGINYSKAYAFISVFFLLLGLSPISRFFSIFWLFEREHYFVPMYMPYTLSIIAAIASTYYLRGNKSKLFVAAMNTVLRTCMVISTFMIGYFLFNQFLIYIGSSSAPEYCMFPGNVLCQNYWLSSPTGTLTLSFINGLSKPIVITHISCTRDREQAEPCTSKRCRGFEGELGGVSTPSSGSTSFTLRCNDENGKSVFLRKGEYYAGKLVISFRYADEPADQLRKMVGSIGLHAD